MKRFFKWLLPLLVLASCNKETGSPVAPAPWRASSVRTEGAATLRQVTLGKHLDSPYLVENVRRAYEAVYPTRSGIRVEPTALYVRFLPAGPEDRARLEETDIDLFDYPLDYEILSDGDWYHDPSLPEDRITWQYAVVPVGFAFPEGIPYEVLDKCCFPGSASLTRAAGEADWDAVERAAFEMTGNGDLLESGTRASKTRPEGRITIVDTGTSGRKTVGVSGVKVTANTLLKTSSAYTDAKGNYSLSAKFSAKPHYHLKFKNTLGFKIGLNLLLVQASSSSLGKGPAQGLDVTVDASSDGTLWRRCVVNNAAYDYYVMCRESGIAVPVSNLRFWTLNFMNPSCALMLHHGAMVDTDLASKYLGVTRLVLAFFSPDITIGCKGKIGDYAGLYFDTVHEMAHASHFQKAGTAYWNRFARYVLFSYFATTSPYGTGNGENAGLCEVAEMWAYYLENALYKDRYGKEHHAGESHWFRPQILTEVEKAGVTRAQICAALGQDVQDASAFCKSLQETCPAKKSQIASAFSKYGKK